MIKILKIIVTTLLILGGMAVPLLSCVSKSAPPPANQVVTVQRGNLTIDITGSGNLAYSSYEDLAFQISGTSTQEPLTVAEVLVEAGDSVTQGQVLVKADTTYLEQAITTAQQAAKTAEIDFETAKNSYIKLTYPYDYRTFTFDVPAAVALAGDAQRRLDQALKTMQESLQGGEQSSWEGDTDVWHNIELAKEDLIKIRENLIRGYGQDVFETGILRMTDFWTFRAAQLSMDKAQISLDKAIEALNEAKDKLNEAVIAAPFAGFATIVNVKGGDQVQRGIVAVRLVDPNKFEADVMVNEMDIFKVKLGGNATVQINAMPTLILPATVTFISPTATISSGVVNYDVKVELQSLPPIQQQGQPEQVPITIPKGIQLRDGLTVIVSIPVEERDNVLLVPNAAITSQGGQFYVQVVLPSGTIEQRVIKTGTTNYQYTEVTSGLSEGEKVVVPQGTVTTPTTSQQRPSGGIPIFEPPRR